MDKKKPIDYSDLMHNLISILKFKDNYPIILGSAGDKAQLYYSDLDFFCPINKKYTIEEIMTEILNIFKRVNNYHDFYFTELKIQLKDETKIKIHRHEKIDTEELKKIKLKNLDFIKIDFVTRELNSFIEVSCIYKFFYGKNASSNKEFLSSIHNDMEEYIKDKNYFKALKREYSANNLNNTNTERNEELLKLFNGESGKKYKILNNLKALKLLKENNYNDELTKQKIKLNLKELKLPQNTYDKLNDKIKSIEKDINNEAKKITYTY